MRRKGSQGLGGADISVGATALSFAPLGNARGGREKESGAAKERVSRGTEGGMVEKG